MNYNIKETRDLENYVLHIVMLYNELFASVAEILNESCFIYGKNRKIYKAICSLSNEGHKFDMASIVGRLMQTPDNNVEPADFGEILGTYNSSSENLVLNSRVLADMALRRNVQLIAMELSDRCNYYTRTLPEAVEDFEKKLNEQLDHSSDMDLFLQMRQSMDTVFKHIADNRRSPEIHMGFPTGFRFIDYVGGLDKGSLSVIAGRPSHGKSMLAMQWAVNGARNGWKVAYFSLEMTNEQLTARALAMESRLSSMEIRKRPLTDAQLQIAEQARESLDNAGVLDNITLRSVPSTNIQTLCNDIRNLSRRGKLQAVFIDYLQQLTPDFSQMSRNRTEETEIGNNVKALQSLALQLNIVIVLLSQLNRNSTLSADGRPRLSETRGSGRIEEFIDNGFIVYQPLIDGNGRGFTGEYADVDPQNTIMFIEAKHRNGHAGDIHFLGVNPACSIITPLPEPPRYSATSGSSSSKPPKSTDYGDLFEM